MTAKREDGVFADAIRRLDRAFEFADLDAEALERLKQIGAAVESLGAQRFFAPNDEAR